MGRSPLTVIEFVIGVTSIIGGLYVISPLLTVSTIVNGASPLVQTIGSQIGIGVFGTLFIISGCLMTLGIIRRNYRVRSIGAFLNMLLRIYALLANFLIQGFLPLTWMSSFVVLITVLVCWIVVKGMIIRGEQE